jgi:YVTN family beta-propeller protein
MDFRILGPLEVAHEGGELPLGGRQQRALLALLLLHANEVVAVDEIVDALWPETPPPSATKSVHALVSRLRGLLEGEPVARNGAESDNGVLLTRRHGYSLRVAPGELDLHRFDELLNEGRVALAAGEADVAARTLREALALWRGPPLAELAYASFARGEVARLQELRLSTLEERIEADLAAGRPAELVPELESLVARHPLRERLRRQLMLALYRTGRQPEALQAYQAARRLLVDELGIEPTPALQRLERAILVQEESLEPLPLPRPAEPIRHSDADPPVPTAFTRRARRRFAAVGVVALLVAVAAVAAALLADRDRSPAVHVDANSVAVIDATSNRIERQVPVGARPTYVTSDGRTLWVANLDDDSVSRIDPRTGRVVRTIATDASTAALAVGTGSVWVANSDAATVSRIDPFYDRVSQTIRIRGTGLAGFGVSAVAFGFGSLWVAETGGTVSRVDPASGARLELVVVGGGSRAIAVGAGAVWVANAWDDTVSRIDPTNVVTATIPVGRGPSAIAVGAGAVWVANGLDNTVSRIDAGTGAVQQTTRVGKRPTGIAAGAGAVWVANGGGTVSRIDPRTNEVSKTIRIGGSPAGVAAFGGSVWVTVAEIAPPSRAPAGAGGGVARFNVADGFDFTDPALAYLPASWQLEYATCAKLLNYPDRPAPAGSQLVPEVARSLPVVSDGGRRFTFSIRDGYRFSPPSNQLVTAQTFKYSIERSLSPKLKRAAVAPQFVGDIVGTEAYRQGRVAHIAGVIARGTHLTVELTHAAPDFPARIAMPFFCAVPIGTPVEPGGLPAIPSAGPYYVVSHTPKQQVVLRRNPNYRGPRPHQVEQIVYTLGVSKAQTVAQIETGQADYAVDGVPAASAPRLAARYGAARRGTNEGPQRYFSEPVLGVAFLALNTSRPLFADANLRKAVNYAIDRPALARQKQHSWLPAGEPTDQYLPPGAPGFKDVRIYPLDGPDVATARRLAGGKRGRAVLYTCDTPPCPQQAQIVRANLRAIGVDVDVKEFPYGVLFAKATRRGEPFDIVSTGWLSDYPDPFNVLNVLLDGSRVTSPAHSNWAYFDDPTYNRKLTSASTLSGPERYRTYGALDADLARNAAPLVAFANYARRDFFSSRIGCQVYQPVYGFDLAALCLRRRGR